MHECVAGPYRGYFIAAYASHDRSGRFVGYYKVVSRQPQGYFEGSPAILKGASSTSFASGAEAVAAAMREAAHAVGNLPRACDLAAVREGRTPYCWEVRRWRVAAA